MRLACVSLVVIGAIATSAGAKTVCNTPAEIAAVQVRQLQIEMMVSTMRCDSTDYNFRQRYGAFMGQINPLLTGNAKQLEAMLRRQHKGDFDRYITAMANDAQDISQQDPQFCTNAVQILEQVTELPPKDIPAFAAQTIPSPYQATPCPEKHRKKN